MAADILKAAEDPTFPGLVPWDNPADMLVGYVKAVPRSQRTEEDQWSCSLLGPFAIDPATAQRLHALCKKPRWEGLKMLGRLKGPGTA